MAKIKNLPKKITPNKSYELRDKYGYKITVIYRKEFWLFGDYYYYVSHEGRRLFRTKKRTEITSYLNGKQ